MLLLQTINLPVKFEERDLIYSLTKSELTRPNHLIGKKYMTFLRPIGYNLEPMELIKANKNKITNINEIQ